MPDITISELELTPEIADTLQLPADDATGNTVKFTVSQLQEFITKATQDLLPDDTGQIKLFAFPTDNIPDSFDNYSLADGGELVRNDNAELFAKIGTAWGEGDGSTTFNKPNALDRFPRAYSDTIGAGVYYQDNATAANGLKFTGTAVTPTASFSGSALPGHTHTVATMEAYASGSTYISTRQAGGTEATKATSSVSAGTPSGTVTVGAITPAGTISGDAETRPKAIILVPYVQVRKFP